MQRTTRREILHVALGTPLAFAACSAGGPSTPPLPPGDLLDPGRALGHAQLKDKNGTSPHPLPVTRLPPCDVVVVGAGVAGLAAAHTLQKSGLRVVGCEIADDVGGTALAGRSPVSAYPWGAHYITAPLRENQALITFLAGLGMLDGVDAHGDPLPAEEHACRAPEERVFYRGRHFEGLYLHEGASADDVAQLQRFMKRVGSYAEHVDAAGRRAFIIPRALASTDAEILALDTISFGAWLDAQGFTSWRLRWFCDYACRDDYGLSLAHTSAWAGLFYFCARKRDSTAAERPVLTWPEGNGRLVRALGATGVVSTCRRAAVDVVPTADGVDVVVADAGGARAVQPARAAIVAVPGFIAQHIVRPLREEPGARPAPPTTSAWAVCNVHLSGRPSTRGVPLAWDTVLLESESLGYVTATHQSGNDHGATVLTWYRPLPSDDPAAARNTLFSLDRDAWAEACLSELSLAHPGLRALCTRVDVCRWGHAMPRPVPGTFTGDGLARRAAPMGRIHFAHTDLSGIALFEEAFFHGARAADAVVAQLTATASPRVPGIGLP